MPIYEFVCESCGRLEERLQKISDPPPEACLECGAKMAKIMSRNSFQLKGGGWYKDLYGSSGAAGTAAEKSKPEAAKGAPAAGGSTAAAGSASSSSGSGSSSGGASGSSGSSGSGGSGSSGGSTGSSGGSSSGGSSSGGGSSGSSGAGKS
jgi:putative FmdB family regulatory protein